MSTPKNKFSFSFFLLVISFLLNTESLCTPALAQDVTRLTFNIGPDIYPAWDPRGVTIAYIRPKTTNGSVYDAYNVLSSGQGGEQALLTGLNADFGVAVGLSWIGTTGFLGVEEAISGFEDLKFNTALAPFDRTIANGSDTANQLLLSINGGGGGGLLKISRDGTTALTRFSTSGSGGTVSIRTGLVSNMTGQVASAFGTVQLSVNAGSDGPYQNGGSINPDGSQYVLAVPLSTSTTAHDLILSSTTGAFLSQNLTNSASSGVFNIEPDFSPDGTKIVFARGNGQTYDLYTINTNGTGLTQLTDTPNFSERRPSWSPDGGSVAYMGIHSIGHETESPALQSGETANWNIYMLRIPPVNIVTPKTQLTEPPFVTVDNKQVTFTFASFIKAQKAAVTKRADLITGLSSLTDRFLTAAIKKPTPKYSFQYELVVTKSGAKKKDAILRTSKKNSVTIKNLPVGTYSANYRVVIMKKVGSTVSVAGRTKSSPSATFTVS